MLKFIGQGSMEMMWISGTNPMVSLPNLPMVRELLTKENLFVVVQDIFPTETTAIADVVLPAAAWGEKTGCFTNVDRTVHLSLKAVDPPGEAKSDFDIFCDFSRRMDFRDRDGKPLIPWTHPSEAFEAWKKVSKGRPCDYSGMTYEKLQGGSGIQWPCNEEHPFGKERLFDDGKFFTDIDYCEDFTHDLETGAPLNKNQYKNLNPAGRAILKACHYVPETEPVNEDYPYHLSTGRLTHHFHTRTKTGRTKELQDADPEPFIQVSEHDAKELGVKEGEMVLVESRRGKVEIPVRVGRIADKQVFIPFHYGYFDSDDGRARAANELTRGMMAY
jgi:predicted molibdopterin-dependent oxidoreductase YjgC